MIITRSPLRISLGGGGTDVPSYYEEFGGFFISAAIDKYVYLTLHKTFIDEMILKYSEMERVKTIAEIRHPILRECLKAVEINDISLEITSMADLPSGTGLGSSGSFTTALLKLLHTYKNNTISPEALAEQACEIEIGRLREPIGKQDQFISSVGGVTCFHIEKNGLVNFQPLDVPREALFDLEDNLMLFFTGFSRPASTILKEQDDKSRAKNTEMTEALHLIKELGLEGYAALKKGDTETFARLMNTHWEHKKRRSKNMSNSVIDDCYNVALKNGALGGKLIGAGGGGFLMFYCENKSKLREALKTSGFPEVRFRFDFEGTKVLSTE